MKTMSVGCYFVTNMKFSSWILQKFAVVKHAVFFTSELKNEYISSMKTKQGQVTIA